MSIELTQVQLQTEPWSAPGGRHVCLLVPAGEFGHHDQCPHESVAITSVHGELQRFLERQDRGSVITPVARHLALHDQTRRHATRVAKVVIERQRRSDVLDRDVVITEPMFRRGQPLQNAHLAPAIAR